MALIARMATSASKLLVRPALVPVAAARTITTSLAVAVEGASDDYAARMAKAQLEKAEAVAAKARADASRAETARVAEEAEAVVRSERSKAMAIVASRVVFEEAALLTATRFAKEEGGKKSAEQAFYAKEKAKKAKMMAALVKVGVVAALGLWVDWVFHEDDDIIKYRMAKKLRDCVPLPEAPAPPCLFEMAPLPLAPFLFNILVAPTGAGKTTLLRAHVRAHAVGGTPAMYISVRRSHNTGAVATVADSPLRSIADRVYEQIGFPTRRALLLELAPSVKGVFGVSVDYQPAEARRLSNALQWFIDAACEVSAERLVAKPNAAVPVLVFDEMHDLVQDSRLAAAGGRVVFNELASALANAVVDRKLISVIAAGSSSRIVDALPSNADGNRYKVIMVPDPKDTDVKAALERRGYTPEDAAAIIALVGTRLRLLHDALQAVPPPPVATFKANAVSAAEANFAKVRKAFVEGGKGTTKFCRLLERVEAAHAGGTPVDDEPSLASIDIAPALFRDRDRHLRFQSDLHRHVWVAATRNPQWCQETAS